MEKLKQIMDKPMKTMENSIKTIEKILKPVEKLMNSANEKTIATIPKNTTPTSFRSISGFALPSVGHNNQILLWVSYF